MGCTAVVRKVQPYKTVHPLLGRDGRKEKPSTPHRSVRKTISSHPLKSSAGVRRFNSPQNAEKFRQYARALGVSELEFIIAGTVTDEELLLLYNLCALFVMPSWHEGFGLPALEAMRCGAPVIGANTASLPELIADSRALFDPFNTSLISAKIEEVLSSPELLGRFHDKGSSNLGVFPGAIQRELRWLPLKACRASSPSHLTGASLTP